MRKKIKKGARICTAVLFLCVFLFGTQVAFSATGKIAGKVLDAETNQPLLGANILVEATTMGAASDDEGNYFIFLTPGVYSLKVTMMGYDPYIITDLLVNVGLTTVANITLNPTVIEGKVVTVIAEEPVIKTDVASSQTILQGEDVSAIPVSNFKQVLDKQVGIEDVDMRGLFMRGQRQYNISLMVDGQETRDNVDDQVYTNFNPDELEQVQINAGGFEASYGNATAGVISLVTKEGGNKYFGTFDFRQSIPAQKHFGPPMKVYFDRFYGEEQVVNWKPGLTGNPADTLADRFEITAHNLSSTDPYKDRPLLLRELYNYWLRDEVSKYGDKSDFILNATFGGPLPLLKNTGFFSSYRREKNYYLYPGPSWDHFFDQNLMFKLTTRFTPNLKLAFTTRYTETTGLNRYDYYHPEDYGGDFSTVNPDFQGEKRYVYEGVEQVAWSGYGSYPYTGWIGKSSRFRNQYGLTITHTLSSRTFYEVKLLVNRFRVNGSQTALRDTSATHKLVADRSYPYTQGAGKDSVMLTGPQALAPLGYWPTAVTNPFGWVLGGTYGYSEVNYARDITFRANITSQIDKYNQVEAGFEYIYYDIKKRENRDQQMKFDKWRWHIYPQKAAFWVRDKVEFEGLVLSASLRGDVRISEEWFNWRHALWDSLIFYPNVDAVGNWSGPRYHPPTRIILSPRLSVSHPIGETAKIFFNWGHYYQEQSYEKLYIYYRRDATNTFYYGDPEMPFRKSIQYEIGYEHNLQNIFRIALSGYYKDVKNLTMDRIGYRPSTAEGQEFSSFYTFATNRYQNSQGLEARVEKRAGRFWTAWLNFNIMTYGRGIHGFESYYQNHERAEDTDTGTDLFDYEDENRSRPSESHINTGVDFHTPSQFGPRFLGFHPAADMNLNFLFWWRQQPAFDYNPRNTPEPYAPRNNRRWKAHWGVNMTFNKRFDFGGFITPVFYVEVYNLFNTKNMWRGAFDEKEAARDDYIELIEKGRGVPGDKDYIKPGGNPGERSDIAEEIIGNNPTQSPNVKGSPWFLYLNPRQVWLGIRFEIR